MTLLASIVVVAFALFLVGLTVVVFVRPAIAERFFLCFANSARSHYTEMTVRLLVGLSLVVLSPAMWQPTLFRLIGWAIVVTSIALILTPWRWHHRFGQVVLPTLVRRLRMYALGLLAFGCLLLYGTFAGARVAP